MRTSEFEKQRIAFRKLEEKLQNLEGSYGLIQAQFNFKYKTAYPSYGYQWGYEENPIEHTEAFVKALKKACTLCKNFKYNGQSIAIY